MQNLRTTMLFYCIIAMMAALFFSRALLSAFLIAFVILSFLHTDTKGQLRKFFSTPLLWGMSLLFLLPLLSGLWSEDKEAWSGMMLIKLPLLFLPLAFAGPFSFSKKQWTVLAMIFIALVAAGSCWSFFHYLSDPKAANEAYLQAKLMRTPLGNDHVRFSWIVSLALVLSGLLYFINRRERGSWALLIIIGWFIIFLHLLAARTGLFSFYLGLLLLGGGLLSRKLNRRYGIIVFLSLLALPVIAYFSLPSFQNRVKYFNYDLGYFKKAEYLPGSNDAVRVISMRAGLDIMRENAGKGVGFGDLPAETNKWYDNNYPGMLDRDRIIPSSEWLIYGAGCGLPGLCLFTLAMLLPFFVRVKYKLAWWMLQAGAALGFMVDIGLEVQFGVFIYSFIVLWWWKWLKEQKI